MLNHCRTYLIEKRAQKVAGQLFFNKTLLSVTLLRYPLVSNQFLSYIPQNQRPKHQIPKNCSVVYLDDLITKPTTPNLTVPAISGRPHLSKYNSVNAQRRLLQCVEQRSLASGTRAFAPGRSNLRVDGPRGDRREQYTTFYFAARSCTRFGECFFMKDTNFFSYVMDNS